MEARTRKRIGAAETRKRARLLAVALFLSGMVSGCGVVRYREMTIAVRDEMTGAPIPNAYVSAQMMGEMFKWNCGKVPLCQSGATDNNGVWRVTLPRKRGGCVFVDCAGFEQKLVNVQEDTFDGGNLEVKLTPRETKKQ